MDGNGHVRRARKMRVVWGWRVKIAARGQTRGRIVGIHAGKRELEQAAIGVVGREKEGWRCLYGQSRTSASRMREKRV